MIVLDDLLDMEGQRCKVCTRNGEIGNLTSTLQEIQKSDLI